MRHLTEITEVDSLKIHRLCDKIFPYIWDFVSNFRMPAGHFMVSSLLDAYEKRETLEPLVNVVRSSIVDISEYAPVLGSSFNYYKQQLSGVSIRIIPISSIDWIRESNGFYHHQTKSINLNLHRILQSTLGVTRTTFTVAKSQHSIIKDKLLEVFYHEMAHAIDFRSKEIQGKDLSHTSTMVRSEWVKNHWELSAEITLSLAKYNKKFFNEGDTEKLAQMINSITFEKYIRDVILGMHYGMHWLLQDSVSLSAFERRRKRSVEKRLKKALVYSLKIFSRIRPELRVECRNTISRLSINTL